MGNDENLGEVILCISVAIYLYRQTPSVCVFQRRTKQKVVTNFATVKGISPASKPRAALKQVLFSQGVSDKNNVPEVPAHHTQSRSHTREPHPEVPLPHTVPLTP